MGSREITLFVGKYLGYPQVLLCQQVYILCDLVFLDVYDRDSHFKGPSLYIGRHSSYDYFIVCLMITTPRFLVLTKTNSFFLCRCSKVLSF